MGADEVAIPGVGLPTDRLTLAKQDLGGAVLKPEEMFVVSRLFGSDSTVADLLASTGLPRPTAIQVLRGLLHAGIFRNKDGVAEPPATKAARSSDGAAAAASARLVDPAAVDLSAELQTQLLALEQRVKSEKPRVVLGVSPDADAEAIKAAFFSHAARFHPDQFFRKKLGSFQGKVEQIFSRMSWAFQELQRNPRAGQREAPKPIPASSGSTPGPADAAADLPTLDPSALPELAEETDAEITGRPRDRFRKAIRRREWAIARAAVAALAVEEPDALDIPKLKAELGRAENEYNARVQYDHGLELGSKGDWGPAAKCFEQAATLDPRNPVFVERAGRAQLYEGNLKEAKQLVERALELKPEDPTAMLTLANVFWKAGMEKNARRQFEAVLKVDPKNPFAKAHVRKPWWKG